MRLEIEAPITPKEQEIEDILVKAGYPKREIQFRGQDRYLRIGYWQRLPDSILAHLSMHFNIEMVADYDDDCGYIFWYQLNFK
jgi:hypothetical protein